MIRTEETGKTELVAEGEVSQAIIILTYSRPKIGKLIAQDSLPKKP